MLYIEEAIFSFRNDMMKGKVASSINNTIAEGRIHTAKTISSQRNIEMIDSVKEFFIAQSLETGLKNTYVFLDKNNNYYGRKVSFAYRFKMLQKKIDMQWVSNTMGHESLDITLQVYAHFIPRKEK